MLTDNTLLRRVKVKLITASFYKYIEESIMSIMNDRSQISVVDL